MTLSRFYGLGRPFKNRATQKVLGFKRYAYRFSSRETAAGFKKARAGELNFIKDHFFLNADAVRAFRVNWRKCPCRKIAPLEIFKRFAYRFSSRETTGAFPKKSWNSRFLGKLIKVSFQNRATQEV